MNKRKLAKMLADRAELDSAAQGAKVIDAILDSITDELAAGGTVPLKGFGKFSTQDRKARNGCNPRTGKSIKIKAHRVAKFTPGSGLKQAANSPHFGPDWLKFKDISLNVKQLKHQVESKLKSTDQLGKEAKKYLDKAQTLYEDASDQIQKASGSSGKAWKEIRVGLDRAFAELKDAWEKAKEHF